MKANVKITATVVQDKANDGKYIAKFQTSTGNGAQEKTRNATIEEVAELFRTILEQAEQDNMIGK